MNFANELLKETLAGLVVGTVIKTYLNKKRRHIETIVHN